MRGFNIWRPVILISIALLTNMLVTNLCMLFGLAAELAKDIGFIAMIIAALITFNRINRLRRK
ncbi:hypothetical protein D3C76_1750190 [compost metagenome]